jgi:hypothetical protein
MPIFNFNKFILESNTKDIEKVDKTMDLCLSHRFISALEDINTTNIIRNKFLSIIIDDTNGWCKIKTDISFLDVTDNADHVSYVLSSKANPILDKHKNMNKLLQGIRICWTTNRQEQRLGRLVNRIFKNEFQQKDVEDFVIEFVGAVAKDKTIDDFEIIEGSDVKKYYLYSNNSHEAEGSLQHSCMKYPDAQKFIEFYAKNPNSMKMLILKSKTDEKIYGRANLWYLDEPKDRIFMDRVYTTFEWQNKLFIDYAIKNNWIFKNKQIYGGSVIPVVIDGKIEKIVMSVKLKLINYDYYPYVDTLQFYNPTTGELTSNVKKFNKKEWLTLVLPNGEAYQGGEGVYKIDYLGRIVHSNYVRHSNYDNVYVHVEDAVLLEYRDDYVTPEHDFIVIDGKTYLKNDTETDKNGIQIPKKKFNI